MSNASFRLTVAALVLAACGSSESPPSIAESVPSGTPPPAPPVRDDSTAWEGTDRFECANYNQPPQPQHVVLRKVHSRGLKTAIRLVNCDLRIVDSNIEATSVFEMSRSTVRIEGGTIKGDALVQNGNDAKIVLAKGAHVVGALGGNATVAIESGEWIAPTLWDEKIAAYAVCLALSDVWAGAAASEYLAWAQPIERGKHPVPPEQLREVAYPTQWCALEPTIALLPQRRAYDDKATAYVTAQSHLVRAYKDVRLYYTHEDYKDDNFARALALHQAYVAAEHERVTASLALHDAIAGDVEGALARHVAVRKAAGANELAVLGEQLVDDATMLVLELQVRSTPAERPATRAAIVKRCETIAADYDHIQDALRAGKTSSSAMWSSFERDADAMVIAVKKGRRVLATAAAPGDPAAAFPELTQLLAGVTTASTRL